MSITTTSNPHDEPMPSVHENGDPGAEGEDETWEEDDGEFDEYDDDADAKAEELARMWGNDLLAQISAHAAAASANGVPASDASASANTQILASLFPNALPASSTHATVDDAAVTDIDIPDLPSLSPNTSPTRSSVDKKVQAALQTMRSILAYASKYSAFNAFLSRSLVPGLDGGSVLEVFTRTSTSGNLSKDLAARLRPLVLRLLSDPFFSPPPAAVAAFQSPSQSHLHPSLPVPPALAPSPPPGSAPAPTVPPGSTSVPAATPVPAPIPTIPTSTLTSTPAPAPTLSPSPTKRKRDALSPTPLSSSEPPPKRPMYSLSPPSHPLQITVEDACSDIFASLTHARDERKPFDAALVSSIRLPLYQVFLFAITSCLTPEKDALRDIAGLIQALGVLSHTPIFTSDSDEMDTTTAVHPCPFPACHKTFARLSALCVHERAHSSHCPFACAVCGATFVLEDDLRRHAPLHERRTWQCSGCATVFARRDALVEHAQTSPTCAAVDAVKAEAENTPGDASSRSPGRSGGRARSVRTESPLPDAFLEEGEIHVDVLRSTQSTVLALLPLLQSIVKDHAAAVSLSLPSYGAGGQATLVSLLANPHTQTADGAPFSPSSKHGLSDVQTKILEQVIKDATDMARQRAEVEASRKEESRRLESGGGAVG